MPTEDDFISSYNAGRLIFFVGAGASIASGAAMPPAILAASAALFLPAGKRFSAQVKEVLKGRGVAGAPMHGIQPEIFYEHLLAIGGDLEALGLWRILSPPWLASQQAELMPNANHLAIVDYSARHGLPVFTTNFDMLFEAAAARLDIEARVTVADPCQRQPPTAEAVSGRLELFKLHGSILVEGQERLQSLQTTMQGISAVNQAMIALLLRLARQYTLCFVGYSGCDIDYFPVLAGAELDPPPFWFNPRRDPVTSAHAARIRAREIHAFPDQLFAQLDPAYSTAMAEPPTTALLNQLKRSIRVSLDSHQKLFLLAQCLQSIGRNEAARELLVEMGAGLVALPRRDRIAALLLRARVEDCLSEYGKSAESARAALGAAIEARHDGAIDRAEFTAFRARALYHAGMARQQQIGPLIRYGDPRLDWRPSGRAMLGQILGGLYLAFRLMRARAALHRLVPGNRRLPFLRAEHAINDHMITLLGRIIAFLEAARLARLPLIRHFLIRRIRKLLSAAAESGDYFNYAHAHKYLNRLRGIDSSDQAIETYGLLRDPLNHALVCRDAAVRYLEKGDHALAARQFRLAAEASFACGSRATMVKSLVGLAACGALTEQEAGELASAAAAIEGAGYRGYWLDKIQPFLAALGPSLSPHDQREAP